MFIVALFTIAKTWKQPKCPSTDEWRKMWDVYVYVYICVCVYIYTYIYLQYIHIHIYILYICSKYTYTHTHIHSCIYTHIHKIEYYTKNTQKT